MSNPKWTVLFLVHAVDDQSRYYSEQLFTELLQVEPSNAVRIFVLRNTYDYHDNTKTHAYLWELVSKKGKRAKKRVYPTDINYPTKDSNKKSFGKVNFGNPETLGKIFDCIKNNIVKDNKIMLFTWDHGYAFGIFDPKEYDSKDAKPIKSVPDTDMLMVKELAHAIEKSFTEVDILIMMNCWMQSIETNCQLQGRAKVLVAPETSIDWLGYDYVKIINALISGKHAEPESLAKIIIDTTIAKYKDPLYGNAAVKLDDLIISATRPKKDILDPIREDIKELARILMQVLVNKRREIAKAREATDDLTDYYGGGGRPWCFIDLLQFVANLRTSNVFDNGASIDDLINKLKNLLRKNTDESLVIEQHIGKNFSKKGLLYGGISICFPNNAGFVNGRFYQNFYYNENKIADEEMKDKIAFAREVEDWPRFVDAAIKTGEIKMGKPDKNYFLNINSNVHIDKQSVVLDHIIVKCREENDQGLMKDFTFPARNFLLNLSLGLNVLEENVRIDSLIVQCTSFDSNTGIIIPTIGRGAGGGKQNGAGRGGGKQNGAGGGKQNGAGGGKQNGAGGGQLINSFALEKKEDI